MVLSEVHGSCLSSRNSRDAWKIMARKGKAVSFFHPFIIGVTVGQWGSRNKDTTIFTMQEDCN